MRHGADFSQNATRRIHLVRGFTVEQDRYFPLEQHPDGFSDFSLFDQAAIPFDGNDFPAIHQITQLLMRRP